MWTVIPMTDKLYAMEVPDAETIDDLADPIIKALMLQEESKPRPPQCEKIADSSCWLGENCLTDNCDQCEHKHHCICKGCITLDKARQEVTA